RRPGQTNRDSMTRAREGLGSEKFAIDRAHVDVPAFAFGRVGAREITSSRVARLNIDAGGGYHKFTLVRVDCDFGVGHRTIAIGEQVNLRLPQLAAAIVTIDIR